MSSNLDTPFFFDKNLTKNFKIFGQVLYIYFDPTFRRHVSVIDIGLKQKATIFVDEVFKYRNNVFDNNFQFLFHRKKNIFFLKPVHFLNSKNERVLKRRYFSSYETKFSFLKLNNFSLLSLNAFKDNKEKLFNFRNENFFSFIYLKTISSNRLLKSYKIYALIFLNLFRNSKKLKHKFYKILTLIIFLNKFMLNIANNYNSFLYLCYIGSKNFAQFFSWFISFQNRLIYMFTTFFSDLKLKKLFSSELNNFFNFKSEKNVVNFLSIPKANLIKSRKNVKSKKPFFKILKSFNRSMLLKENSNLFSSGNFCFPELNKLEFSFNSFNKHNVLRFNFLKPYLHVRPTALVKKLRTRNYYSVISRGRAYALVNRLSFFNTFAYGGFLRRRVFKNWLKFSIYLEKLNYLIILNNEEVSNNFKFSAQFFHSLYFPLIFNFRNLFFNLIKFFKHLKYIDDKLIFRNFKFFSPKRKLFNKRFFGVLLNFLLQGKKLSKTPKNLLLNSSSIYYKTRFSGLNFSTFNNLSLMKQIYIGLFKVFMDNINYVIVNLNPSEKFINEATFMTSFINFSLGFDTLYYQNNQINNSFNLETSKNYLNQKWISVFKIFKSLKIVSKYARKYRRKANFSKRRKFKLNLKKRGYFLSTKGGVYRHQKLFIYPFKNRVENTQRWSYSVSKARVSPTMSRYGAYLDRINALSKKFKSKVRVFSLNTFKNRLNLNFDLSKYNSSYNYYFRKNFKESFSSNYRIKRSLNNLKKDKFIRNWDKHQFYANPTNKFFKGKPNYGRNKSNKIYNSWGKFSSTRKFTPRVVNLGFNNKKKPIYRQRFNKKN